MSPERPRLCENGCCTQPARGRCCGPEMKASNSSQILVTLRQLRGRVTLLAVPFLAAALACGGGNENLPPPPPPPPAPPAVSAVPGASAAPSAEAPAPPPPAPVTLTQGTASPDPPAPLPSVKILTPAKGQLIPMAKAGDFEVKLDVKNWKTAKGDAHVHLILDAKPYHPVYDPKNDAVKLSELNGGDPLAEGQHVLVSFPSRANHESVKTPGALAITEFWIGKKGEKAQDIGKPMIIYSRPKGEYKGDMANHVLVDFQFSNGKLSPTGDHAHITVTGPGIDNSLTADATQFGPPFYLDGVRDGSYSVKLELLGKDGKLLPGPWNSMSRSITIAH